MLSGICRPPKSTTIAYANFVFLAFFFLGGGGVGQTEWNYIYNNWIIASVVYKWQFFRAIRIQIIQNETVPFPFSSSIKQIFKINASWKDHAKICATKHNCSVLLSILIFTYVELIMAQFCLCSFKSYKNVNKLGFCLYLGFLFILRQQLLLSSNLAHSRDSVFENGQ